MKQNSNKSHIKKVPGKEPIVENDQELQVPIGRGEVGSGYGRKDNNSMREGKTADRNSTQKPHKTTVPSTMMYDGIRDGDREAYDEIPYDEEDDYPREHR